MICQCAVIHHLEQDVEHIRMRLFDFVQQQHAMRMLIHAISQKSALIEPDIAWRRANQAGYCVFFHVFGHVKTQQLDPKGICQLFGHFGFTNTCWPREEIVPNGLFWFPQTRAGQFDRRGQGLDRFVLAEHHALECFFQIAQHFCIVL